MMRQTFENWYSDGGKFPRAIERDGEGYRLKHAHDSWTSWQIAAAITAASCADIAHNWRDAKTGISCCHRLDIEAEIKEKFGLEIYPPMSRTTRCGNSRNGTKLRRWTWKRN